MPGGKARWELHNDDVLKKSLKQHPTKQQYGHLPPISQTPQLRWARYAGEVKTDS